LKSIAESPTADLSMHKLRNCEAFSGLVPGYLAHQLPDSRTLLFEDHLHQCVACRHVLEQSQRRTAKPSGSQNWRLGAFPFGDGLWRHRSHGRRNCGARIEQRTFSLVARRPRRGPKWDGSLYSVSGEQVRVIPAGYQIRNGDEDFALQKVRTLCSAARWIVGWMDERSEFRSRGDGRAPRSNWTGATLSSRRQATAPAAYMWRPTMARVGEGNNLLVNMEPRDLA